MEPMTVRCEVTACWTSVGSGEKIFSPFPDSVSRTTLLKTLVVAAFGTPGRTTTVGSRAERPTTSVIMFQKVNFKGNFKDKRLVGNESGVGEGRKKVSTTSGVQNFDGEKKKFFFVLTTTTICIVD